MTKTKLPMLSRMLVFASSVCLGACAMDTTPESSSDSAGNSVTSPTAHSVTMATANTASDSAANPELIAQGQRLFNLHCMACHSVDADGRTVAGPHLEGIFGRQNATEESWLYPKHVAEFDFVWTQETMRQWLVTPQQMINNMCLPFRGLRRESDVDALMAYLVDET